MELSEALSQLRALFLSEKHQVAGMFFWQAALEEVAMGDVELMSQLQDALDAASPGGSFAIWVDGGRLEHGEYVYRYDRKPELVSKVIGKALERARQMDEAA